MTIAYDADGLSPEQVEALDAVAAFTNLFGDEADPMASLTFLRKVQAALKVLALVPGEGDE